MVEGIWQGRTAVRPYRKSGRGHASGTSGRTSYKRFKDVIEGIEEIGDVERRKIGLQFTNIRVD